MYASLPVRSLHTVDFGTELESAIVSRPDFPEHQVGRRLYLRPSKYLLIDIWREYGEH